MTAHCDYCNFHPEDTHNRTYHDIQYGFPLQDDNLLFECLILEINQAGLSWITILKKADNYGMRIVISTSTESHLMMKRIEPDF